MPVEQIEDPDMNPNSYTTSFLTKDSKTYDGEKIASSTNGARKCGYLPAEK
jgi:hypothetical protein